MKKYMLVCLSAIFVALAVSCSGKDNPATVNAHITLDCGEVYNWGEVWLGSETVLSAKIKIFNSGTDTLVIKEIKPSCGCTTAPIDKDRIEPSGYATLDVTLTPGTQPHDLEKSIDIKSNDPDKPVFNLKLKANLKATMSAETKFLAFNAVRPGKKTEAVVRLKNLSDESVTINDISVYPDYMQVSVSKGTTIPAKSELEITVSFTAKSAGLLEPKMTITTTDKNFPVMRFLGRCLIE